MEERSRNHHMELFKTTGILDEPILREVAKWGIPKLENRAAIICFIVSLVLSAARYPALAAVFFSVGLFFVHFPPAGGASVHCGPCDHHAGRTVHNNHGFPGHHPG